MSRIGRHAYKNVIDLGEADSYDSNDVADRGIYFSSDGQRRMEELHSVRYKKRRLEPSALKDVWAEWIPVPDNDFGEDAALGPPEVVVDAATVLGKRKEYISTHLFKCGDCGEFLQCKSCCLETHKRTPLHTIQVSAIVFWKIEWNGTFWVDRTLAEFGLIYQLGHGGFPCPFPDDAVRKMTVIEAPIIHEVRVRYCKCEKSDDADNLEQLLRNSWYPATVTDPGTCATFKTLEAYRMYNVVGNMNVRDFITALQRVTDTTASSGMTWLPERYKQFQRMARQWAFLKRLRRAGRGHDPAGVDRTKLGQCAVNCWACPHEGRNLPDGWRDVDPKYQFLYMLILAVDANFRLKNRMRANEIDDPSLGPGWGYWVEPEKYASHVKKYVNEKDVSTCIAFAALLQKDTRITTGLRVSGVGGCVCARHECMRPNGLGDLQKGERYANMDFIVASALAGFCLLLLTISYDIACQWKTNLAKRMEKLPADIRPPLESIKLQCALPVWHAASHVEHCQDANSLSFKTGVGKSDGEGVERTWSRLNPAAFSTKDAGRGQRADTLEGKIDDQNYLKNVGLGESLQRKLVVAIAERDKQIAAFKEVNKTVSREVRSTWEEKIEAWVKDDTGTVMNPFVLERKGPIPDCPTEAEVRLAVRKDEDALNTAGKTPLHGRSATAFLTAGIQIEDAQRRIITELKGTVLVAADRENKIQEWRHALLVKLTKFRNLQAIYMPGAAAAIAEAEQARDTDASPRSQSTDLAALGLTDALAACVPGLVDMEAKLRIGQCDNSLVSLRSRLHAKRFLIGFRNENVTGQIQATKARTLIGQVGERVEGYAKRYRKGYGALRALKGEETHPHLRELKPEDVRLDGDNEESDVAARKKLSMIGSGKGARAPRNAPGTSRRIMSWIWTAPGALDQEEERLHDSIRVEWARAWARKLRWTEEVMLLREEMRRVLRYLAWQTGWWRAQQTLRTDWSAAVAAGAHAYASKQAAWHERLAGYLRTKWNISALTAAQQWVAEEGLNDFFGQD
ncbi:hypothetical protein B0H13DRAFT_2428738 [Mycena leptocephala]|nr:hypothetical protein B0H13DRAFT_2428738 [Mycena leptocephala]